MTSATTKHWTVKDVTVSVTKKSGGTAGEKLVAFLEWLGEQPRPDQGLPGSQPGPDQGLPPGRPGTGGRPDQGLPGSQPGPDNTLPGQGGRPDQGLPGSQPHPDQGLPGQGGRPDNSLPEFIGDNAKEIAKEILGKCFDCKDGAQPK